MNYNKWRGVAKELQGYTPPPPPLPIMLTKPEAFKLMMKRAVMRGIYLQTVMATPENLLQNVRFSFAMR